MAAYRDLHPPPFVFPDQYPNPFPSFSAPTNSEEWGRMDAHCWIRECNPSKEEIQRVYDENKEWETAFGGTYHDGVEVVLGWHVPMPDLNFNPGGLNYFTPKTRWHMA
jgi:hypothetical protein